MSQGSGVDGRPRMVDVGRLAAVSAQTVSRYFTGGYVGASSRARIERAVQELGYRPHAAARRLKTNRPDSLGFIAMGRSNFGAWSIIEGITAASRAAGFTLVIGQLEIQLGDPDLPGQLRSAIDHLLLAGIGGIIVATPYPGSERILHDMVGDVPMIVISERPESGVDSVSGDSYAAGILAMEHLIGLGHRRILHVAGDPATIEAAQREAAYHHSLSLHGLATMRVPAKDWTADSGHEVGAAIDPADFTAVFAANDAIALGFMSALRERGLTPPLDYSIIGIDSMPEGRFAAPPLSSVALDFVSLGQHAVGMMLDRLQNGGSVPVRSVSPRLVVRRSTGPA